MATKGVPQRTKRKRSTSGVSDFHEWRVTMGLTQGDAAELLGVTPNTAQRWDAHPGAAPGTLDGAMNYHTIMRHEVKRISSTWLDSDRMRALLVEGKASAATEANLEALGLTQMLAVEYGLSHGLF